jgi:hypothetical protein
MLAARVLPVLFNTVTFQVVYAAMYYFPLSACQMNVAINLNDFGGGGGGGDDDDGKGGSNIIQVGGGNAAHHACSCNNTHEELHFIHQQPIV